MKIFVSQPSRVWNPFCHSIFRVYYKLKGLDFDIIREMNIKHISVEEVIKYLNEEIDGMGKKEGFPRNPNLPYVLKTFPNWELRDITEDEFVRLIVLDGSGLLIRDEDLASVLRDDSILVTQKYLKKINNGEDLNPLIVRIPNKIDPPNSSFYIEDGAHRAIAAKVYFEKNPYKSIKAFIRSK